MVPIFRYIGCGTQEKTISRSTWGFAISYIHMQEFDRLAFSTIREREREMKHWYFWHQHPLKGTCTEWVKKNKIKDRNNSKKIYFCSHSHILQTHVLKHMYCHIQPLHSKFVTPPHPTTKIKKTQCNNNQQTNIESTTFFPDQLKFFLFLPFF